MLMAPASKAWTLEELDRLPDDGNKYELVDGELFVTPAPRPAHEVLIDVLIELLVPYVSSQQLGRVNGSRTAVRTQGSHVEPDLTVRPKMLPPPANWELAPLPLLVVEVLSRTTQRRDHEQKRAYYLRNGVPEYWIVDGENRTILVIKPGIDDVLTDSQVVWHPRGAEEPFVLDVAAYFREALGPAS